jgi:hypothetical protein
MRTRFVGSGDLIDVDMVFGSVSAQGSRSRPEDLRVTRSHSTGTSRGRILPAEYRVCMRLLLYFITPIPQVFLSQQPSISKARIIDQPMSSVVAP